ncbi:alpha/beta-hydrolase [Cubamyces sp. BRFM 1775]|nr:alpha/beta-hydrolase [Cubamyces sp. BRFM 1775]
MLSPAGMYKYSGELFTTLGKPGTALTNPELVTDAFEPCPKSPSPSFATSVSRTSSSSHSWNSRLLVRFPLMTFHPRSSWSTSFPGSKKTLPHYKLHGTTSVLATPTTRRTGIRCSSHSWRASQCTFDKEVISALSAARAGDYDRALAHLDASQELIVTVATAIDCEFVQLCDFAEQTPDGTLYQSGAYAGLFISKASGKPFMGVGFKGTNSLRDQITDLDWQPIVPPQPEIVWGAPTHRGFYLALFGQFTTGLNSQVPFEVLVEQLSSVYTSGSRLHFTGHSLGGAFSALAYAEFLRRQEVETAFAAFALGDMYTYGGPRSSYEPFATELNKRTQAGSGKHMFRIVNSQDPVPTIPPLYAEDLVNYPYVHARGAWRITVNGPEKMDEEPPAFPPLPTDEMVGEDHNPFNYYTSWQSTPHS